MLVFALCGVRPSFAQESAPDPSASGPFAVGVIERSFSRPSSTTGAERRLETVIWYPAVAQDAATEPSRFGGRPNATPAKLDRAFPVLLFSHGSGGEPWQSTFLTVHLASHGYVVIAPSHPGNTAHDCPAPCLPTSGASLDAFVDSAANRPADVIAALDQALALASNGDLILSGLMDEERVGILGHSFGGWTALQAMAVDSRFKAAAPMAPAVLAGTLPVAAGISGPTLLLAGDLDRLTRLNQERLLSTTLGQAGGDHWLVILRGAGHLSFTDLCGRIFGGCGPGDLTPAEAQPAIKGWTTAFMMRYVALDDRHASWLESSSGTFLDITRAVPR